MSDMQPEGIYTGDQRHDKDQSYHPFGLQDSCQSAYDNEDSETHPYIACKAVGAVPVFLVVQCPGEPYADSVIVPCLWKIIADNGEKHTSE